ncbi:hypothetical protein Goklo_000521 [Gossypium klotzschianum]|uniref:Leucine-rich repeat-containing N-terminal plant-type domain-containing protein n=1 Tax=Gossypium klotzschianum TaxID=34286 RepID=A0A7J8VXA0_9ROSI|nr:hypothetical protein [Gossypium klotzschianum]
MMERLISVCLWLTLVLYLILRVACNAEGDVLNALKTNMADPNNVLQSWDPTLVNPCTWYHVTCNDRNSVTRVDLQNANLSGQLVPQLGQLPNLQYLELYGNNISGIIPEELGNLTNLLSLDLYLNNLTGGIPTTLGKLTKLQFLWSKPVQSEITTFISACSYVVQSDVNVIVIYALASQQQLIDRHNSSVLNYCYDTASAVSVAIRNSFSIP